MHVISKVALCVPIFAWTSHALNLNSRQASLEAEWNRELEPDLRDPGTTVKKYASPVKRVTNLLQKMKAQLEEEAKNEADMYDKMVCWCETNDKEKTKAIADAEANDEQLSAEIAERSAKFGKLSAEISQMKDEIASNQATLDQAVAIREKEAGEFRQSEKDLVQAITNLRNAIAVLSKHQGTSLLQTDKALLSGLRVLLRDIALKYEVIMAGRSENHHSRSRLALLSVKSQAGNAANAEDATLLSALDVQGPVVDDALPVHFAAKVVAAAAGKEPLTGGFLQVTGSQPIFDSRSSARSAGIYGIMNQMLEEFQAELSESNKDDTAAQGNYEKLSAAKTDEITTGKKKLDEMQAQDAGNAKALSDAKEDLDNVRKQRSADVEFLRKLKLTCNDLDDQWKKRSLTRTAETQAVADAISILTEDDNRETLARSISFLQQDSRNSVRARAEASLRRSMQVPDLQADDLLAAWHGRGASRVGSAASPRSQLSTLALSVKLDSFEKVKKMMDTMVEQLKKEQAEEVKTQDYCGTELKENERTVYDKKQNKKKLEAGIEQLDALMTRLSQEIDQAKDQIAQTQEAIKSADEARKNENSEFQRVVADQQASQNILRKAHQKLKDFYAKGINKLTLAQAAQEPPVKFNSYKNNAGSSSVIGLIEQIIEDSEKLVAESTANEGKAQADYAAFVQDSQGLIKNLQESITAKTKHSSEAKADSAQKSSDLDSTYSELESLAQVQADLHAECDFLLKNFDIRQSARLQEIEAIQQAKAILSGSMQS